MVRLGHGVMSVGVGIEYSMAGDEMKMTERGLAERRGWG